MSDTGISVQTIPGDFELDKRAGELRKDGLTIRLPEQLFRLLALLAEHSGEVVTREQIRGSLWSDRFVNFDDSINSAIKRLRQCLADSAMNPRLIKTLPGRGYRFAVPTEPIRPISKVDADAGDAREPRLAVLPFRNLSGNPAEEHLAAGLTDALVTALTKVPKLHVVSRRSAPSGKGVDRGLAAAGRMSKVDAVVRGTVLRSGNYVRVTVQLLQVATEEYLWAENYDYMLSDILAFHSDVSGAIAEHVSEKLLPGRPHRLPSVVHPRRPAAYQAFLKGHHVFKNVTDEGLWKARHYWKKAIREDPHYARAYAGLAESYNMLGVTGLLPALEAAGQAREAAIKALEIDESLGEAHNALGFTRMVEWDWDGAGKEFRRALQLDPNFAAGNPCHYVEYLLAIGRPETAVAELERAQELQPLSLFLSVILGWTYYGARQYDKAVRQHRRVVEIEPHFGMAHWCLGLDYSQKRRYRTAIEEFQQARLSGGPHNALAAIGYAYAMMGEREKAEHFVRELKRLQRTSYTPPYAFAAIYAGLGEADAAFEWLGRAQKAHDVGIVWLKWDPQFDNVRSDPRFQGILGGIGLQAAVYSSSAAD
ncbi:MAG: winged helix-turn-helix domain-containing protein [Acidobacteriia bacterium]|nr:winged helix-turn-helix domain-containing protein [Terriglobia bacterium]